MGELHDRLVRCFSSVFPTLTETEICGTDLQFLGNMDSLAGVTLIALINEEFGVDIDVEELLGLGTFEAIREHLREEKIL